MRLRDLERAVLRSTRRSGAAAYVVGGALRDAILGKRISDVDLAVSFGEERLARDLAAEGFGRAFALSPPGAAIAVWRVARPRGTIDVARFENAATIQGDLARRDFTVNAMAREAGGERVIDPFGGTNDLRQGTIRALSETNLRDDPLRVLRAYRLAAMRQWRIDRRTRGWLSRNASGLRHVAPERVHDEIARLFAASSPTAIRWALADGALAEALDLKDSPGVARAVRALPKRRRGETALALISDRLAILFHAAGIDAARAAGVLARRKFARLEIREITRRLRFLTGAFSDAPATGLLFQNRGDLVAFLRLARCAASDPGDKKRMNLLTATARDVTLADAPLNGDDLRNWLGIAPGRVLGRLLEEARFRWFTKEWRSRQEVRRGVMARYAFDRAVEPGIF